ncbi:TPA: hypothetical protein N0F65_008706 [Lagenidium giganteum]|uniref:Fungal lipase-type domain-containing protein n=1 Tax=Lagenidium giganteum TaxID=4803 RepID=A0AAV2YM91_9STRA|nr:TPA: hypothetical protein N0F65_008706 [Lagenidium giganteum]
MVENVRELLRQRCVLAQTGKRAGLWDLLPHVQAMQRRDKSANATSCGVKRFWSSTTKQATDARDKFAVDTLPALKVLAESIELMKQSPAFTKWTSNDWLMGLTVLAQHNTFQRRKRRAMSVLSQGGKKLTVETEQLISKLLRYVRVCDSVYASTPEQFCAESEYAEDTIVRSHPGGIFSPKFILLMDHDAQEIMVAVRGSASIMDFCTDICVVNEPFRDGEGHRGIVHAASWLVKSVQEDLVQLQEEYPDYKVILTGHSLGAGAAALASIQMKEVLPSLECYAFATPASVTSELALECAGYVTTIVNKDDCIPRLHQHSILRLQEEVCQFDWKTALKGMIEEDINDQKKKTDQKVESLLQSLKKKRDETKGEILQTLRTLEELKDAHQNEAKAKMEQVKQNVKQNFEEFSNEIERRMTTSLEATKELFDLDDDVMIKHVAFMKKIKAIANEDDQASQQGEAMWWGKMDASILTLEKLVTLAKTPEDLKLVAQDSIDLRDRVVEISQDLSSHVYPQATLFIDRIDEIISQTTAEIVEATEKLLQEDEESHTDEQQPPPPSSIHSDSPDSFTELFRDLHAEATELLQFPLSSDGHVDGDSSNHEATSDDTTIDPADADSATSTTPVDTSPPEEEISQAPLFPPGRVLYLNRLDGDNDSASTSTRDAEALELVEVGNDEFSRVVLSNQMIWDHLCTEYERTLKSTLPAPVATP